MIRKIVLWPDPVLAKVCDPVPVVDQTIRALADDMLETMYAAPGRGLAASQVGVALRLFVMDADWKTGEPNPVVMINPDIIDRSDTTCTGPEGCLSIPGVTADVERAAEVHMAWTDRNGLRQSQILTGFAATCAQHEMDHLDGIVTFDRVTPETRKVLEAEYAP